MFLENRMSAVVCIIVGMALAACGPESPPTASITPTGQTDAPSMPQSEQATTTPIPTSTPHRDTVAAPTATSMLTPTTTLPSPALSASLQGNGPIDAQRCIGIVNAYTLAFFDVHLKGQAAPLLDGPSPNYPEVTFTAHNN